MNNLSSFVELEMYNLFVELFLAWVQFFFMIPLSYINKKIFEKNVPKIVSPTILQAVSNCTELICVKVPDVWMMSTFLC